MFETLFSPRTRASAAPRRERPGLSQVMPLYSPNTEISYRAAKERAEIETHEILEKAHNPATFTKPAWRCSSPNPPPFLIKAPDVTEPYAKLLEKEAAKAAALEKTHTDEDAKVNLVKLKAATKKKAAEDAFAAKASQEAAEYVKQLKLKKEQSAKNGENFGFGSQRERPSFFRADTGFVDAGSKRRGWRSESMPSSMGEAREVRVKASGRGGKNVTSHRLLHLATAVRTVSDMKSKDEAEAAAVQIFRDQKLNYNSMKLETVGDEDLSASAFKAMLKKNRDRKKQQQEGLKETSYTDNVVDGSEGAAVPGWWAKGESSLAIEVDSALKKLRLATKNHVEYGCDAKDTGRQQNDEEEAYSLTCNSSPPIDRDASPERSRRIRMCWESSVAICSAREEWDFSQYEVFENEDDNDKKNRRVESMSPHLEKTMAESPNEDENQVVGLSAVDKLQTQIGMFVAGDRPPFPTFQEWRYGDTMRKPASASAATFSTTTTTTTTQVADDVTTIDRDRGRAVCGGGGGGGGGARHISRRQSSTITENTIERSEDGAATSAAALLRRKNSRKASSKVLPTMPQTNNTASEMSQPPPMVPFSTYHRSQSTISSISSRNRRKGTSMNHNDFGSSPGADKRAYLRVRRLYHRSCEVVTFTEVTAVREAEALLKFLTCGGEATERTLPQAELEFLLSKPAFTTAWGKKVLYCPAHRLIGGLVVTLGMQAGGKIRQPPHASFSLLAFSGSSIPPLALLKRIDKKIPQGQEGTDFDDQADDFDPGALLDLNPGVPSPFTRIITNDAVGGSSSSFATKSNRSPKTNSKSNNYKSDENERGSESGDEENTNGEAEGKASVEKWMLCLGEQEGLSAQALGASLGLIFPVAIASVCQRATQKLSDIEAKRIQKGDSVAEAALASRDLRDEELCGTLNEESLKADEEEQLAVGQQKLAEESGDTLVRAPWCSALWEALYDADLDKVKFCFKEMGKLGVSGCAPNEKMFHCEGLWIMGKHGMKSMIDRFKEVDTNGNGELDLDEVVAGASRLDLTPDTATRWFRMLDTDNSGSVSMSEFLELFNKAQGFKVAKLEPAGGSNLLPPNTALKGHAEFSLAAMARVGRVRHHGCASALDAFLCMKGLTESRGKRLNLESKASVAGSPECAQLEEWLRASCGPETDFAPIMAPLASAPPFSSLPVVKEQKKTPPKNGGRSKGGLKEGGNAVAQTTEPSLPPQKLPEPPLPLVPCTGGDAQVNSSSGGSGGGGREASVESENSKHALSAANGAWTPMVGESQLELEVPGRGGLERVDWKAVKPGLTTEPADARDTDEQLRKELQRREEEEARRTTKMTSANKEGTGLWWRIRRANRETDALADKGFAATKSASQFYKKQRPKDLF